MTVAPSLLPDDPGEAARLGRPTMRTRQILVAAARLMERDGYEAVSLQALAEEDSVSVGPIYRYFGNKQDLLPVIVQMLDTIAGQVPAAVTAGCPPTPLNGSRRLSPPTARSSLTTARLQFRHIANQTLLAHKAVQK